MSTSGVPARSEYQSRMLEVRRAFEADGDGPRAVDARRAVVDEVVSSLWAREVATDRRLAGVAIAAIGGYGRGQLFPHSDVDLLVCAQKPEAVKDAIRRVSQTLWDAGLQVALMTRAPKDCEHFEATNPEFGLALLDLRYVTGDREVITSLERKLEANRRGRDGRKILAELGTLTRERYAKYGGTLFHLEPNIKDCPGGLRDTHVCSWVRKLVDGRGTGSHESDEQEFQEAIAFLTSTRCFLHWRHERDDNVLDWLAQDAAAEHAIGLLPQRAGSPESPSLQAATRAVAGKIDAAYWMRVYFRHARFIERRLLAAMEAGGQGVVSARPVNGFKLAAQTGFRLNNGRIELDAAGPKGDPAQDPDAVLRAFAAVARTGVRLSAASEDRIETLIPMLSRRLEEGAALWLRLAEILTGPRAGVALRSMHAVGVLELILPEFHGIDTLVIRDAYHRYTVDEHTFVLIDTLHELEEEPAAGAPAWRVRLGNMIRELEKPALLYLAALLHDTGKGRAGDDHATESSRLAQSVLNRLELDPYDQAMVLQLIETHLEMSAALRRDIFDTETVRTFAGKVQTHESLWMLTLFTYGDIRAVHPDALTPWKAENLWRLSMSTANQLDRNVDQERVQPARTGYARRGGDAGRISRLLARGQPAERGALERFVEGFPERYVRTRPSKVIYGQFQLAQRLNSEAVQLEFEYEPETSQITLVSCDRPGLFAAITTALAAWGMNVVTAEAFANAEGVVVDSFRFQDTFRTLELNESERERFVASVHDVVEGRVSAEAMLSSRRRGGRRSPRVVVETAVEFDDGASATSTLMQVVAQDVPGLLRTISVTLSQMRFNVEVALVDTEGETAIDVFYLTQNGTRLTAEQKRELRDALVEAINENAR